VAICSRSSFLEAEILGHAKCCDFNDFAKAMADKTRQRILSLLHEGELNEGDIVAHLELTQPTISHHLALLRRANLVSVRREGKYVYYRVNSACVTECCGEILARFTLPSRKV
jgi:ArsR family transcriptional regulator, arsenate/arsenite/antimonite-responsive transcriptional repressor